MRLRDPLLIAYSAVLIVSMLGSGATFYLKVDPGPVPQIFSFLALALATALVARCLAHPGAVAATGLVGGTAELIGVLSGIPFGSYVYTDRWWPVIPLGSKGSFPLLVPLAWILVAGGSYLTMRSILRPPAAVAAGALLAMLIDVPMEALMAGPLGYWKWTAPGQVFGAPISNMIAWFVVSSLVGFILMRMTPEARADRGASFALAGFCALSALLSLVNGLFGPAALFLLFAGAITRLNRDNPPAHGVILYR